MDIKVPSGRTVYSSPFVDVQLKFNPRLEAGLNQAFGLNGPIQKFIDAEFIREIQPFMPFDQGVLRDSMVQNTVIGSGENITRTPYARYLYYGMLMVDSVTGSAWSPLGGTKVVTDTPLNFQGGGNRGAKWDERWAAANLAGFIESIQQFVDKGAT